jgi:hypothetical protein
VIFADFRREKMALFSQKNVVITTFGDFHRFSPKNGAFLQKNVVI